MAIRSIFPIGFQFHGMNAPTLLKNVRIATLAIAFSLAGVYYFARKATDYNNEIPEIFDEARHYFLRDSEIAKYREVAAINFSASNTIQQYLDNQRSKATNAQ